MSSLISANVALNLSGTASWQFSSILDSDDDIIGYHLISDVVTDNWEIADLTLGAPALKSVSATPSTTLLSWSNPKAWNGSYIAVAGAIDVINIVDSLVNLYPVEAIKTIQNTLTAFGPTEQTFDVPGLSAKLDFYGVHLLSIGISLNVTYSVTIPSGAQIAMNQNVHIYDLSVHLGGYLQAGMNAFQIDTDVTNSGVLDIVTGPGGSVNGTLFNFGTVNLNGELAVGTEIINADVITSNTIQTLYCPQINNYGGRIEATNGGNLSLASTTSNTHGTIEANGGTVSIEAVVTGGIVETTPTGSVDMQGGTLSGLTVTGAGLFEGVYGGFGSRFMGALDNVTIGQGVTYLASGELATSLRRTINNLGVLSASNGGIFAIDGPVTLKGGGRVSLANGYIEGAKDFLGSSYWTGVSQSTAPDNLVNVDNTIEGYSIIYGHLTNQSGGVVDADVSGQMLQLANAPVVNFGLFEATNGGMLSLASATANTLGTIEANGGTVSIEAVITGGIVKATAGSVEMGGGTLSGVTVTGAGLFEGVYGGVGSRFMGALDNVTIGQGVTYLASGESATSLRRTINNLGVLSASNDGIFAIDGPVTLKGGGRVSLANGYIEGAKDFLGSSYWTGVSQSSAPDNLVNIDNTIEGYGLIYGHLTNQSDGVVDADVSGQTLKSRRLRRQRRLNGGDQQRNFELFWSGKQYC